MPDRAHTALDPGVRLGDGQSNLDRVDGCSVEPNEGL